MKERLRRLGARLLRGADGRIRWLLVVWVRTPLFVAALMVAVLYLYPLVGGPAYEPQGGSGYDRNREYAVVAEPYEYDSAVFVMRADGSQTRKLMDLSSLRSDRARNNDVPFHVEDFAWSPDGKRILFSSHETPPGSRNRSLLHSQTTGSTS